MQIKDLDTTDDALENNDIKLMIERNLKQSESVRKAFKIGEHEGCSIVFEEENSKLYYPFSYLNDFNPANYRLATPSEIRDVTPPPT